MSKASKLLFIIAFCLSATGVYYFGSKAQLGNKPAMAVGDSIKKDSDEWFEKLRALLSAKSIDKKSIEEYFNAISLRVHVDKFDMPHPLAKSARLAVEKYAPSQSPLVVGIIVRDGGDYANLDTDIVILRKQNTGKEHPFVDGNIAIPNAGNCRLDLGSFFIEKLDATGRYRAGISVPSILAKLGLQSHPHAYSGVAGWDSGDWIEFE